MDAHKRQIARNAAKVEFIANAEEVMSMLDKGFNNFNIYKALSDKGRITMSYRSFCRNLRQLKYPNAVKRRKRTAVSTPVSSPVRVAPKKEGFGQLEDVDVKSLI